MPNATNVFRVWFLLVTMCTRYNFFTVTCGRLVSFSCTPVALSQIKLTGSSSNLSYTPSKQVTTLKYINISFSLTVGRTGDTVLRLFFYIGIVLFCIRINSLLKLFFSIGSVFVEIVLPTPESRKHKKVIRILDELSKQLVV